MKHGKWRAAQPRGREGKKTTGAKVPGARKNLECSGKYQCSAPGEG